MADAEPAADEEPGEDEEGKEESEDEGQAAAAAVKEAGKEAQKAPRAAPPFVIQLVDPEVLAAEKERAEKEAERKAEEDRKKEEQAAKDAEDPVAAERRRKKEERDRKKKGLPKKEEPKKEEPEEVREPRQGELGRVQKAEDAEFYLIVGHDGNEEEFKSESGVILFPDLWGWNDGYTRAIAEYLATALAAFVVVPKLLGDPPFEDGTDGDGLPPDFDADGRPDELKQWLMGYLWETLQSKVSAIIAFLRNRGKVKRIGCAGFGFGAWVASYTSVICGDMLGVVLAYPLAHYLEKIMGGDTYVMAQRIKCPALFMLASGDDPIYFPGGEIHDIVRLRHPESDLAKFESMERCWILRGDAYTPEIKEAIEQAVTLFQRYLRKFIWPPAQGKDAAALRQACAEGDSDLVHELLEADIPATGRDAVDAIGLGPIHYAAKAGNMQPIRLLIEAAAEVNFAGGASRETPLHLAVQEGRGKASALLLSFHADIESVDAGLQTPLHHAALKGHSMVANLLLKKKAELHCTDTAKQTPLHLAAWKGKAEVVNTFLEKQADIEIEDLRGQTPYQRALQGGSEMVKDILEMEKEHRELEAYYAANPAARPPEDEGGAAKKKKPFVQLEKRTFIPMAEI